MKRSKIIFLIIFSITVVTMVGCEDDCEDVCEDFGCLLCGIGNNRSNIETSSDSSILTSTLLRSNCRIDDYLCAGECTPVGIECCFDSFGDEVGSCPVENPFCCEEYDL